MFTIHVLLYMYMATLMGKEIIKGDSMVVCFPGAKIEDITERIKKVMGPGKGGSILVHVGTDDAEREESTTATNKKYRQLVT